jgi:hypothetical protein
MDPIVHGMKQKYESCITVERVNYHARTEWYELVLPVGPRNSHSWILPGNCFIAGSELSLQMNFPPSSIHYAMYEKRLEGGCLRGVFRTG